MNKTIRIIAIAVILICGCKGKANSIDANVHVPPAAEATMANAKGATVQLDLPPLLMPGPIDPIWQDGECLAIARLGHYASIDELRASPFYAQLCSLYPTLVDINRLTVDTGQGDLWLIWPRSEGMSLAINEYNMQMFTEEQPRGSGQIYYRTEEATPLLMRMSADDPGTVDIQVVDNEGNVLSWIPTQAPQDNRLREQAGVQEASYNPIEDFVDMGHDNILGDNKIRFYDDGHLLLGDEMGRYRSFHLDEGGVAFLFQVGDREGIATIAFDESQATIVSPLKGDDLGIGFGKSAPLMAQ